MLPTVEESRGYDFHDPENAEKWRGLFVNSLRKVLEQVHPTLTAEESALQYVESLCLRLLGMLCAAPSPLTVQDVEERVARTFPTPIDRWALTDARDAVDRTKRRKSLLPTDKLHQMLQKEVLLYKIDMSVSVFMVAILEYISADILKLAGNYVKKISHKSSCYYLITCRDIKTAMCADKVLMDMFYQDEELAVAGGVAGGGVTSNVGNERRGTRRGSLTYAELVRDLLTDERHFLRELHLIIRVFKEEIEKILDKDSKMVTLIFGNIVDIYELTVTLLGNIEDAIEMSQDSPTPYIGSCFEELAEVEEFRAYVHYANVVTKPESREALQSIVDDPVLSERLDTAGHGFRLAVKYYLPKLLMAPVAHMFVYHNYVLDLLQIAPVSEDRESFKQVECNLHPIKKLLIKSLGNGPTMDAVLRMATRARRQIAIEKCNELSRLIENWDTRDIGQCCNEFIREDTLSKIGPGKKRAELRAYLFDGLLLLCKPVTSLVNVQGGVGALSGVVSGAVGVSGAAAASQLRLKEKLHIRKLEVHDRNDTDDLKHCVELAPRCGPPVLLACASCSEKRNWMSDLVMLNTKPMLDRTLDSILLDLERRHPLKLPSPELYRFAVPDSPDNILLEERSGSAGAPLIKGATLLKLVERLTFHIYADLNLVRTFLTTYRSFCQPMELLDLLIERFNIPEPNLVYDVPGIENSEPACPESEKLSKSTAREDWKRYRKEFQQPVKFRVINVLRHWVDQHFYDFERDPSLLEKLKTFLESVDGKPMRKWVQSVLKTVHRKSAGTCESEGTSGVAHVFDRAPPPAIRHVHEPPEKYGWHPLALHPLELARQLTLLEFQLYRTVKPSELVGAVWTKKEKEKTSPNLLRIIKHTTNFTRWMEKWIVESENLEERVAVVSRLLDVGLALQELNNFNGILEVVAAMGSASVHRLRATFSLLSTRLERALEEIRELNSRHLKKYQERLRSINPPCVPFCGMYLTHILHIEEGNQDIIQNTELINFSKQRKVAEITGEIQQYQNQPYCLTVDPRTRAFLESLDPFPGMDDNEIRDYLYEKSLEIEPRPPVKQMPKFPRKYPELSLKPVKWTRSGRQQQQDSTHSSTTSTTTVDDNISVSQLSPTSNSTWDGASVSSLSLSHHEDHKGARHDGQAPVSPRSDRVSVNAFSIFDKGFGLFDKSASRLASTMSLNRHGSAATSPSGREGETSPRPPSTSIGELSARMLDNFSIAPPPSPRRATLGSSAPLSGNAEHWHEQRASFAHDAPPPRLNETSEARHQRIVSDIINGNKQPQQSAPPALSPRNPIVDASCFYGTDHHGFGDFGSPLRRSPRDAPPLRPRHSIVANSEENSEQRERPPALPPRAPSPAPASPPPPVPHRPAADPDKHPQSPKTDTPLRTPGPSMSPKKSPAPQPPASGDNSASPHSQNQSDRSCVAFSFPTRGAPTPSPSAPAPPPPLTPHHSACSTPPPLPPRRRRDSNAAPPTPLPVPQTFQGAPLSGGGDTPCCTGPPPLPPRPQPAPELLRPAQSTILQRRHHAGSVAPQLPPKPPLPAVAPRT